MTLVQGAETSLIEGKFHGLWPITPIPIPQLLDLPLSSSEEH